MLSPFQTPDFVCTKPNQITDPEERELYMTLHDSVLKDFEGFFGKNFKFEQQKHYKVTLTEDWVNILYPGVYETFFHQMDLKFLGKLGPNHYFDLSVCLEDDSDFSEAEDYKLIWDSEKEIFHFRDYRGKQMSYFELGNDFFPFVNFPIMWYFFGPNLPRPESFW